MAVAGADRLRPLLAPANDSLGPENRKERSEPRATRSEATLRWTLTNRPDPSS